VIGIRQGLLFRVLATYEKNDNDVEMANIIMRFEDEERADAVFIDAGYGTGIVSVGRTWAGTGFSSGSPRSLRILAVSISEQRYGN
jgi:hypothetical protein